VGLWPLTGLFNDNLSMASKVLAEESRKDSGAALKGWNYLKYCNLGYEVVAIVAG